MNNRVEINIPDLLKLTESRSINSIAKQYGYSYATVYRRVEELKISKANKETIEKEEIKKVRPLKKSSVKLTNSENLQYINIDILDDTDLQEEICILADNKMIDITDYKFVFSKQNNKIEKSMVIDYETFNNIEKCENLTICNRIKIYTKGVYFTNNIDLFYAELSEETDLSKPIFMIFNRIKGEITSLAEKSYSGALNREGNKYYVGTIFKVSTDMMKRLRESFKITHKVYNEDSKDYPVIKN